MQFLQLDTHLSKTFSHSVGQGSGDAIEGEVVNEYDNYGNSRALIGSLFIYLFITI